MLSVKSGEHLGVGPRIAGNSYFPPSDKGTLAFWAPLVASLHQFAIARGQKGASCPHWQISLQVGPETLANSQLTGEGNIPGKIGTRSLPNAQLVIYGKLW